MILWFSTKEFADKIECFANTLIDELSHEIPFNSYLSTVSPEIALGTNLWRYTSLKTTKHMIELGLCKLRKIRKRIFVLNSEIQ